MDLFTVLTASNDVQVSCLLSQTVSSIFPNALLMIFHTVSNDHESCSLSEMVSSIFPNLVKNSHTPNNFLNALLTASDDLLIVFDDDYGSCSLFETVSTMFPNLLFLPFQITLNLIFPLFFMIFTCF